MRKVNQFTTTDPVRLARELNALEDNASRAVAEAQADSMPLASQSVFTPTTTLSTVSLGPDQQLAVDTSSFGAGVVLPDLDPRNFGKAFVLIKALGANTVVVSCANGAVKYNNGAFPVTLSSAGVTTFRCCKTGYYS